MSTSSSASAAPHPAAPPRRSVVTFARSEQHLAVVRVRCSALIMEVVQLKAWAAPVAFLSPLGAVKQGPCPTGSGTPALRQEAASPVWVVNRRYCWFLGAQTRPLNRPGVSGDSSP
jgi:hypothetical protein